MKETLIDENALRTQVIDAIDMSAEPEDGQIHEIIDRVLCGALNVKAMSISQRSRIHKKIFDSIRGLGIIDTLMEDQEITEIMINGPNHIFVERHGRIEPADSGFTSESSLNDIIQKIVGKNNRRVNESNPITDTRLEDGSRVNVVLPPVALDGAAVTIRRFPKKSIRMKDLIQWNSISDEVAAFLQNLVRAGYNIFVSGGTGSGKTTFLNVLSNYIPSDERVITIEDSAELRLEHVENLIRMETRQENAEGSNEITIRDLIRTSLRMRPDRIIVGEVRGAETLDMLQAMNTGHDGSMSTGHANSPKDMLSRLETMVLMGVEIPLAAVRAQIASAVDIIVHLGRLRDKSRRVLQIDEVTGVCDSQIQLNPLYRFQEKEMRREKIQGDFVKLHELKNVEKLKKYGVVK